MKTELGDHMSDFAEVTDEREHLLGRIEVLTTERDAAVKERDELRSRLNAIAETNRRLGPDQLSQLRIAVARYAER
jgi:hypothetical protein